MSVNLVASATSYTAPHGSGQALPADVTAIESARPAPSPESGEGLIVLNEVVGYAKTHNSLRVKVSTNLSPMVERIRGRTTKRPSFQKRY